MGDAPLLIFITEWLLTYVYIRALQDTTGKGQYNNYVLCIVMMFVVYYLSSGMDYSTKPLVNHYNYLLYFMMVLL